jgi:D-alanyl-D-alanine carboxypeptidase (penicillin-binding protein 5/6)
MMVRGALFAVLCVAGVARAAEDRFARIADAYLVKRDGRVLWAAQENERHAPASLTKMMTALLVLERGALDEPVVVSRAASREAGSRIRRTTPAARSPTTAARPSSPA